RQHVAYQSDAHNIPVRQCAPAPGADRHQMRARPVTDYSPALAEDRRRSATQCPSHLGELLECLSLERNVCHCLHRLTLLTTCIATKSTVQLHLSAEVFPKPGTFHPPLVTNQLVHTKAFVVLGSEPGMHSMKAPLPLKQLSVRHCG